MIDENSDIREFIKFVKTGLEKKFSLNLSIEKSFSNEKNLIFDLADIDKRFFVEIKPLMKNISWNKIIQQINTQKNTLKKIYPKEKISHVLVFQNAIRLKEKEKFSYELQSNIGQQYVFDIGDITNMNNVSFLETIHPSEKSNQNKENTLESDDKSFDKLKESIGNPNYYLAGHLWDGKDQLPRFIEGRIWENGHDRNDTYAVNTANKNDIVYIKTTYVKDRISFLRIKAIGVIVNNSKDGHNLEVNWHLFNRHINIENLGKYRRTFARVGDHDVNTILDKIIQEEPELTSIIKNLKPIKNLKENKSDLKFNEQYRIHRFVRDVLNEEYGLNLIIETTRVLNGASINLDLTDDKAKSYVVILNKDKFSDVANDSVFKVGNKEDRIISNIFTKIDRDIELLISGNFVHKYFAFFDDSFSEDNIDQIRQRHKDFGNKTLEILTLRDILKLAENNSIKYSDYLTNDLDFETEEETIEELTVDNKSDKIPFHLDNVETVDRLNREPVAKSLARLVNNEIFGNKELNHSFMIHLQGEWGSGKSTFLNLLEKNLDDKNQKWIVIKYNAWQNQHINPPWWSFIDQIYRQTTSKFSWLLNKPRLIVSESLRRIIWYSGWHKIMTLIISLVFFGLLFAYGKSMIQVVSEIPATKNIDNSTKGLTLNVFAKLLVSLGSIVGLIYSLSKFLSTPFLMKTSGEAKSFMLRASDPMNRIKEHFNKLISDINGQGYQVAVFIDDIDRCNKMYTVSLLEGIQTLFKDKKVLYVVAGDKNWISTCFENNYNEFVDKVSRNNEQLGDLFLEKAFQLSVRMPNVSERTKEKYWLHILGLKENELNKKEELNETQKQELKQKIAENLREGKLSDNELLNNLEKEFNASEQDVSDAAIETFDEKKDDIKHLFISHFSLVNPNPRSIKRLANNYTMYRNTLVAERKEFNPNKLFRWLIIADMYPVFSMELLHLKSDKTIIKKIEEMNLNDDAKRNLNRLLLDKENNHGGKIEINDIKDILGL
jgi:hypothetical protein